MRTLYLLRHAKSAWGEDDLNDHDRVLNERGRQTAPIIGQFLKRKNAAIDLALCSSAARAQETWDLVAQELPKPPPVQVDERLYLCGVENMVMRLREVSDDVQSLIVVAHNPDMQILTISLSADRGSQAAGRARHKFPTAGLACFELDIDHWPDLRPDCGELLYFESPKRLIEGLA
jgi:phosphohistidine phosphatase